MRMVLPCIWEFCFSMSIHSPGKSSRSERMISTSQMWKLRIGRDQCSQLASQVGPLASRPRTFPPASQSCWPQNAQSQDYGRHAFKDHSRDTTLSASWVWEHRFPMMDTQRCSTCKGQLSSTWSLPVASPKAPNPHSLWGHNHVIQNFLHFV